MNDSAPVA